MLIRQEKGAALDFRRPQVYGRTNLGMPTETAHFPNKDCTLGHVAARDVASKRLKPCNTRTGTNPESYPPTTGDQSLTFPHIPISVYQHD